MNYLQIATSSYDLTPLLAVRVEGVLPEKAILTLVFWLGSAYSGATGRGEFDLKNWTVIPI